MEKQNSMNCNSDTSMQYAYVHADREGRWHAYGESARLLRMLLNEMLGETITTKSFLTCGKFEHVIDSVELDFSYLLKCKIALCSDTSLVIECP